MNEPEAPSRSSLVKHESSTKTGVTFALKKSSPTVPNLDVMPDLAEPETVADSIAASTNGTPFVPSVLDGTDCISNSIPSKSGLGTGSGTNADADSSFASPIKILKQHSNTTPLSVGTNSNSAKKRPYIRTKRPVGYNDKSSITTTTDAFWRLPVNVYDAVLQESHDLLQAATEAQQLGRLKMASAYLLLLHARLVGLGKRFDKATPSPSSSFPQPQSMSSPLSSSSHAAVESLSLNPDGSPMAPLPLSLLLHDTTRTTAAASGMNMAAAAASSAAPSQLAAATLVDLLPSHIELDTAMMEHLARAAAELHAARCSNRNLPPSAEDGDTSTMPGARSNQYGNSGSSCMGGGGGGYGSPRSSKGGASYAAFGGGSAGGGAGATFSSNSHRPFKRLQSPNAREFLAATANQQGLTNAATVTGVTPIILNAATEPAWSNSTRDADATVSSTGIRTGAATTVSSQRRTPNLQQQLKLHHANNAVEAEMQLDSRGRATANTNDDLLPVEKSTDSTVATTAAAVIPAATACNTNSNIHNNSVRCKPATTAMNTVPHANCDARALLRGAPLLHGPSSTTPTKAKEKTDQKIVETSL